MTALSKWRETPYRVNNVHAASDPANGAGYTDFAAQGILDPSITEAIRERQVIEWASALDRPVRDWIQAHVHGSKNINNSRYFTGIGCIVQLDTVDDYQYRHGLHVHMHFHAHRHSTLVSFLPVIQFMTYPWSAYNTTYREETSVWEVLPHHAYGHDIGAGEETSGFRVDLPVALKCDNVGEQYMVGVIAIFTQTANPGINLPMGTYFGSIAVRLTTGATHYILTGYDRP